ncbi:MAG: hypothetical protein K9L30_08790 [Desulfobacterales bacterium]|nr:hypothetical protein [Desulfobacterales bacterium]
MAQNQTCRILSLFIFFLFLSFAFCFDAAESGVIESRSYFKQVGSDSFNAIWQLAKTDQLVVLWEEPAEKTITTNNFSLETLHWEISNPENNTNASIRREGNILYVTGTLNGNPIDKKKEIDGSPWYQSTAVSLRPFIVSDQENLDFWSVREETLGIHKIRVTKLSEEILSINGEKIPVQKVKISLTGILSAFWKSHIWYRQSDGVFVRFEGPSGPPGSPHMIVELISQDNGLIVPAKFEGNPFKVFTDY